MTKNDPGFYQEVEPPKLPGDFAGTKENPVTVDLDAVLEETERRVNPSIELLFNEAKFNQLQRIAKMYASSKIVPEHYQGDVASCAIAIQMACRLNVDPLAFLQSSYIVYGTPGIEAKLAIALLHESGFVQTRVSYEFTGEGKTRACKCSVVDKITGEVKSQTVDWKTVEAEGWDKPKGVKKTPSKWMTIPDLMFQYRSAMWLIRAYYPEVIMGMQSKEELQDIYGETPKRNYKSKARDQAKSNNDSHAKQAAEKANFKPELAGRPTSQKIVPPSDDKLFGSLQTEVEVAEVLKDMKQHATGYELDDLKARAAERLNELSDDLQEPV